MLLNLTVKFLKRDDGDEKWWIKLPHIYHNYSPCTSQLSQSWNQQIISQCRISPCLKCNLVRYSVTGTKLALIWCIFIKRIQKYQVFVSSICSHCFTFYVSLSMNVVVLGQRTLPNIDYTVYTLCLLGVAKKLSFEALPRGIVFKVTNRLMEKYFRIPFLECETGEMTLYFLA